MRRIFQINYKANGISIYSPHTALDNCVGGINDWLAKSLGPGRTVAISPIKSLAPIPGQDGAGAGRLHILDQPVSLDQIVRQIKKYLELDYVRLARSLSSLNNKPIHRIAICAGSGSSVLENVQADLYLTGEMSHHEILHALSNDVSVVLTEHSNSERGYLSKGIDIE